MPARPGKGTPRLSLHHRLHFTDRWLQMVGLGHTQWAVEATVPAYGVWCSLTKEDICILLWNVFLSVLWGWGEAAYIITCSLRCLPRRVTTTGKCFSELVPLLPMPFSLWPPGKSPWILSRLPLGTALVSRISGKAPLPATMIALRASVRFSCTVMSDSLRPHEPQHARPPCPSPTPGVYPNSCPLSRWISQGNCVCAHLFHHPVRSYTEITTPGLPLPPQTSPTQSSAQCRLLTNTSLPPPSPTP